MTDEVPTKVSASFRQLQAAATQLNAVSDELGKSIAAVDAVLKRLNLGISTWVEYSTSDDGRGDFETFEIGYAKIKSTWGIALRNTWGTYNMAPEEYHYEEWLFNDAPRGLRIAAVDRLPELLDGLVKEASTTAKNIFDKIGRAEQMVEAITGAKLSTAPLRTLESLTVAAQAAAPTTIVSAVGQATARRK